MAVCIRSQGQICRYKCLLHIHEDLSSSLETGEWLELDDQPKLRVNENPCVKRMESDRSRLTSSSDPPNTYKGLPPHTCLYSPCILLDVHRHMCLHKKFKDIIFSSCTMQQSSLSNTLAYFGATHNSPKKKLRLHLPT